MIPDCFWIDDYPINGQEWLIEGLLSPYVNILSGQPKVGKSTLAMALCVSIINGEKFLDREIRTSGSVAWMGYDSGWTDELRSKVGKRAHNQILLQKPFDLTNQDDSRVFGRRIRELGCELLVIDHLYGFANLHNLDINNQRDAAVAMGGVQLLNTEFGIPILLIAQASKGQTGSVAHSNYIKGLARVLLEMSGTSAKGRRSLKVIGNEIETSNIKLTLSKENLIAPETSGAEAKERDRDFRTMMERALKAISSAETQDLVSTSSFGKLFCRLGYSSSAGGGRKMVQRYIEMGLLSNINGYISKGPNLGV